MKTRTFRYATILLCILILLASCAPLPTPTSQAAPPPSSNNIVNEPVIIQLDQIPSTMNSGEFVGALNQPIGSLQPSMPVVIASSTCLRKKEIKSDFFFEIPTNVNEPHKAGIRINIFAQDKPIIINSVTYINLGFLNFDESFISKVYEVGGFGGGEFLDEFAGNGGNVRPDKPRTDAWGSAPSVRIEPNQGVTLGLPIQFSEPGVYSYSLEITGQDTSGTVYIFKSKATSFGWLRMNLQPSAIEPFGPAWEYTLCK